MRLLAILASMLTGQAASAPPAHAAAPAPPSTAQSPPATQPPATGLLDPPPDPGRGAPARRARPRTPVASLIQVGDYPSAAYVARQEGDVTVSLAIDRQGRVSRCEVLRSSGSASLDNSACLIARERARYQPARTAKGDAVPDTDSATLAWRLAGQRPNLPPVQMPVSAPAPPPPPRAPGPAVTPAQVRAGGLNAYFSGDDYPAAALRAEEQGRVRFRLTIGPDGRVRDCVVTVSSGAATLDAATCRILRSRARFTPARDAAGVATTDTLASSINWVLPSALADLVPVPPVRAEPLAPLSSYVSSGDYPLEAYRAKIEGRVAFSLLVGADGRVRDCEIGESSASRTLADATCALMIERARFRPARDAAGAAVCDVLAGEIWWRLPASLPPSPGEAARAPPPRIVQPRLAGCPGAGNPPPAPLVPGS